MPKLGLAQIRAELCPAIVREVPRSFGRIQSDNISHCQYIEKVRQPRPPCARLDVSLHTSLIMGACTPKHTTHENDLFIGGGVAGVAEWRDARTKQRRALFSERSPRTCGASGRQCHRYFCGNDHSVLRVRASVFQSQMQPQVTPVRQRSSLRFASPAPPV